MTPAQRQYDLDLAASMIRMANWVAPRSRKISDALMLGAQRIQALSGGLPVSDPSPNKTQPASTPAPKERPRAR